MWSQTLQWIYREVSGLAMSGAVLLGMVLATMSTTCYAFVALPSSSSFTSERQLGGLGSQHDFRSRGAVGAPIMAVSHAAAEEIENMDEVRLDHFMFAKQAVALSSRIHDFVGSPPIQSPQGDSIQTHILIQHDYFGNRSIARSQ